MEQELKELASNLFDIGAFNFGEFITKIGLKTPLYIDLRVLISYPQILQKISRALWRFSKESSSRISKICGVPYTALPIATIISVESNIPMVMKRKEAKFYGTKKLVEGKFQHGENCLIIEDIITSGSSVLETANALKNEGLSVREVFVVVDSGLGARQNLKNNGIEVKSLFTVTQLMDFLLESKKIDKALAEQVFKYLKTTQIPILGKREMIK